jgi:hypothetical protein
MTSPHLSRSRGIPFLLVIAVALAPACDTGAPIAPQEPPEADLPALASASSSDTCYGVQFDLLFSGPIFEGELVGGDLEGTVDIELLSATDLTGRTNTAVFRFTWNITGGVIADLVGDASFVTIVDNRNIWAVPPGSDDPPLATTVGIHRVEGGVRRAKLNYIGQAKVVSEDPFIFENLLRHNGVICP